MIKSICVCDKCGKQVERKSKYKEYCLPCFNDLLDDIGVYIETQG